MADIIDHAHETEQLFFRAALAARRPEGPQPNGRCHTCGAPIADGYRFCNAVCRDEYERDRKRIN